MPGKENNLIKNETFPEECLLLKNGFIIPPKFISELSWTTP